MRLNVQARAARPTGNAVVRVVDGIKHKRLGGSDIVVSELALGTQRWCGADFNSPDPELCFKMMDRAILGSGVNLIDTAGTLIVAHVMNLWLDEQVVKFLLDDIIPCQYAPFGRYSIHGRYRLASC